MVVVIGTQLELFARTDLVGNHYNLYILEWIPPQSCPRILEILHPCIPPT